MIVYGGQSYTGHYDFDAPLEVRGTLIASGGTFNFRESLALSDGGTLKMSTYTLDLDAGQTVTIGATGGNLYTGSVFLGHRGENEFYQEGGRHVISGDMRLGHSYLGHDGTYNLNGGK